MENKTLNIWLLRGLPLYCRHKKCYKLRAVIFELKQSTGRVKPFFLISFLLTLILTNSGSAAKDKAWTEKKLGITIIKATKASDQRKWRSAIKYGTEALNGSIVLDPPKAPRYINLLKNLNSYYHKAGQLNQVADQIQHAYNLSTEVLGISHPTTFKSRFLYSKLLISQKNYQDAIPLTLENISLLDKQHENMPSLHTYLSQLYPLYGLTQQPAKEEEVLLKLIDVNRQFMGRLDKENIKVIIDLGRNYCRQKKLVEFDKLMKSYNLKYLC